MSTLPGSSWGALMERDARLQSLFYVTFIHLSKSPVHEPPPGSPMGPLWKEVPVTRAFLFINFRAPSKQASLQVSPHRAPIERNAPFPEPSFKYLSEFLVNGPPSVILNGAPMERDALLQSLHKSLVDELPLRPPTERVAHPLSPPPHILPDPQQRRPLSRFP